MRCIAETVAYGDTHSCCKRPEHVLSEDVSRRMHHDPATGVRWPAQEGDVDPLAAFARPVPRPLPTPEG